MPQFLFVSGIHPLAMYLVRDAVTKYKRAYQSCEEIDFIIQSPGGSADDAYRIITTLRKHFSTVNIIIPFWAKSAATLLSLGGTKLVFSEFGELGPLDVQLGKERDDSPEFERESALNDDQSIKIIEEHFKIMYETMFIRIYEHKQIKIPKNEVSNQLLAHVSKLYEPMLRQINPYKLGDKRRKLNIAIEYAKRILFVYGTTKNASTIRRVTETLVDGFPDHGTVIDYDLMSTLLTNCHTGKIFGEEYNLSLNDLSLMFIANEDDGQFVGFVTDEEAERIIEEEEEEEDMIVGGANVDEEGEIETVDSEINALGKETTEDK